MISRRHLRIKVLQALYAYTLNGEIGINSGEQTLIKSVQNIYDLFIYQLSAIEELTNYAKKRLDEAKLKHLPTAEDINPNTRFIDNKFSNRLANNVDYKKFSDQLNISWDLHQDTIRKVFVSLSESDLYKNYMSKKESSFKEDKSFIIEVYNEFILNSVGLRFLYEEMDINWIDDIEIAAFLVQKASKSIKATSTPFTKLPQLYKNSVDARGRNEDYQFMINLYRNAIEKEKDYSAIIEERIKNWDFDRVASIDLIIMRMAFAELLECPTIPVKVSINEYIDLAKMFSTPRSSVFINGILDRFVKESVEDGSIKKQGRGLIEN